MWLKALHIGCALLSIGGFILRGVWMLRGSALLQARATRVLPHVVDALLLASALALMLRLGQYPFVHGWLTAKVLAIVVYIVLGAIGLRYGKTRSVRLAAWFAAIVCFGYIIAVALTRQPWPISATA